jgi:glycosidase
MYSSYHGYWPQDDDSDPTNLHLNQCFGSKQDLIDLADAAHAKGMKVLYDYAMVHIHKDSQVYKNHPNDWFWPLSTAGICSGSKWDDPTQRTQCWFTDYLPHWNYLNADARKYSVDNAIAAAKQLKADAFRCDAIKHVDKQWLKDLRSRLTSEVEPSLGNHFYLVGETYTQDRTLLNSYIGSDMLDGQFDFPVMSALGGDVINGNSMSSLRSFYDYNDTAYGSAVMSPFAGNHDIARIAGSTGTDDTKLEHITNAFAVLATMKGAPLIYYGDEVGMTGGSDPYNREMYPWSSVTSGTKAAWMRDRIGKYFNIRGKHSSLRHGTRTTITADNDLWFFKVVDGSDTVYVAINNGGSTRTVSGIPSGFTEQVEGGNLNVPARRAFIWAQ